MNNNVVYEVVCELWDGESYDAYNLGIYSSPKTAVDAIMSDVAEHNDSMKSDMNKYSYETEISDLGSGRGYYSQEYETKGGRNYTVREFLLDVKRRVYYG